MSKKVEPRAHPAPFSLPVLDAIEPILEHEAFVQGKKKLRVLDPFAGIGRIHDLPHNTVGVELEPEWAQCHKDTEVGDATKLRFRANSYDAVVTSPCYGNRMSDHHENKDSCKKCEGWGHWFEQFDYKAKWYRIVCDACKGTGLSHRRSYKHYLGRDLSPNNAGELLWHDGPKGRPYRLLHQRAWTEAVRVSRGLIIVNCKNHLRTVKTGEPPVLQKVTEWHMKALVHLGCSIEQVVRVQVHGYKFGANRDIRDSYESIIVARVP